MEVNSKKEAKLRKTLSYHSDGEHRNLQVDANQPIVIPKRVASAIWRTQVIMDNIQTTETI